MKGYSKAARRRFKKLKSAGLPELAETPKRQPNGQLRDRSDAPKDPTKTALDARCRQFGVKANEKNRKALSGTHMSAQLGMVLERLCSSDNITRIWTVWQGFSACIRTYRIYYIGQTGEAKCASITMVPDHVETDQSHSIDIRDYDQRAQDASNNFARWSGYLGHLSARDQQLIHAAQQDRCEALWRNGSPTSTGVATYAALNLLAAVVEQKR